MSDLEKLQLFENKKVRTAWNEEKQEWYFSIVDVCGILAESKDYDTARKYWSKLKERLIAEGNELVTNCLQLKMVSPKDGKRYNTDVADMQGMLRVIQSIPSKKAEPIKVWMAQVATKGLTKENLRDNMTNMELLLNALAEESATELSKARNPEGLSENASVAKEGAEVAKTAREDFEKRIGHSVVSPEKAIDYIKSPEELQFPDEQKGEEQ